ncbi:hypothetical protein RND81_02G002400 [Saponaria officinalis]|uniref:Transcription factor UPBEAT1 n=1 Tax=Saponaria officinalis TaxID=3572 RepID=A0AAW1MP63_SAPOF
MLFSSYLTQLLKKKYQIVYLFYTKSFLNLEYIKLFKFEMETPPSHNLSNKIRVETQRVKQERQTKMQMKKKKRVRSMKRRTISSNKNSRLRSGIIKKRVRTLKRMIPNRESKGLDGLFTDAATYIVSLQFRVKLMQRMLHVLAASQLLH